MRNQTRRAGFTLAELVVVIGIILILMSILLPAIGRTYHQAVRSRMQLDLQAIATALEAYHSDFGQYPRVYRTGYGPAANKDALGAYFLCRALIGPEDESIDGANGVGFRTRRQKIDPNDPSPNAPTFPVGKVRGPYLDINRFKTTVNNEIADRYGKPILYYPANAGAKSGATDPGGSALFVENRTDPTKPPLGYYNAADNGFYMTDTTLKAVIGAKPDGHVNAAAFSGPFLLWSAGPDQQFGPQPDTTQPVSSQNRCDDVANFQRSEY